MQFVGLRHGKYHPALDVERIVCNIAGVSALVLGLAGSLWFLLGALLLIPEIRPRTKAGRIEHLHREKFNAVVAQDYTRAAEMRDELRALKR